jgi:hypothetical protein
MAQVANIPITLVEVLKVPGGATIATYILPLVGAAIAIAGLGIGVTTQLHRGILSRIVMVVITTNSEIVVRGQGDTWKAIRSGTPGDAGRRHRRAPDASYSDLQE